MPVPWSRRELALSVGGVDVAVSALVGGLEEPAVFLHGFGTTKEEYADVSQFPGLVGRGFVAYDAPGFGASTCSDLSRVDLPFLVDVALAVLDSLGVRRFHVVGHSMGGLTALLLAARAPQRVLSFADIEGNLAPEDCFLSRQIVTHRADDPTAFLTAFAARASESGEYSSALYGVRVLTTVTPEVVAPVFESMVDLSDHGDLLETFLALPMRRTFVHGEQNAHLGYLDELRRHDVSVVPIEHSGHWPMYSNPPALWSAISEHVARSSA